MRLLGLGLSCCLMLTLLASPLLAQSETKAQKAAIVFDVRMDKITGSPLGKSLDLKGKMDEAPKGDGPDMSKLVRIYGASTAPADMAAVQSMQQGDLPVEFFVRFEFKDAEAAKGMLKQAMDDNDGTIEKNGRTYYKAPVSSGAPEGVMMYSVGEKMVEVGTEGFAFRSNAKPFTAGLNESWAKVEDHAVRFAFDMEAAKTLVDEMVTQAEQGNPMAGEMAGVFRKMKGMSLSIDMSSKNLLTMKSTGKTADDATAIKEAMDGMLFMGKQAGKVQAKQMEAMDKNLSKVVGAIVDGMKAVKEKDTIVVTIPRPEGFEAAVTKAFETFVAPMMGMGGMSDGF